MADRLGCFFLRGGLTAEGVASPPSESSPSARGKRLVQSADALRNNSLSEAAGDVAASSATVFGSRESGRWGGRDLGAEGGLAREKRVAFGEEEEAEDGEV